MGAEKGTVVNFFNAHFDIKKTVYNFFFIKIKELKSKQN